MGAHPPLTGAPLKVPSSIFCSPPPSFGRSEGGTPATASSSRAAALRSR